MTQKPEADSTVRSGRIQAVRRALGAIRRRGWADRLELLHILGLAVMVELGLRVLSLPRLARWLGVAVDMESENLGARMQTPLPEWAVRRIRLTRAVLKYSGQTCLRDSLILARRLKPLSPRVRIGISKANDQLTAHAWLEVDGEYFDPVAALYHPLRSPASE